jgi:hypothetical protein
MENVFSISFLLLPFLSLCCGLNPGYTLAVNGNILEQGGSGDFLVGTEISFEFGSCAETPSPPAGETIPVRMAILSDAYPEETGFAVTSDSGDVVADFPVGSFSVPNGMITETVNLVPGDYQLEIMDSYGDGLRCGDSGQGRFEVYALLPGGQKLLVEGDGTMFTYSMLVEFSVPSSPTPPGLCLDDQSGSFLVDSEVGEAGCEWLSMNLDRYGYLCQFLDVTATCPNICDACEYFE